MRVIADHKYRYVSTFNRETGVGIRSNVFDEMGVDTKRDPFMGGFPELLDIGIMGHCLHGQSGLCLQSGVECYQNGLNTIEPNMTLAQFKSIIDQCHPHTFQVALGGRGDPDMHPDFEEMLSYAYGKGVIPNFTTSGFGLQEQLLPSMKKYCGAVAVSWYRNTYTLKAIEMLIKYGIRTNIHYCLSNTTIDEAINLMKNKLYPEKINRIIFLLHKPMGLGREENVLKIGDPRLHEFFSLFDDPANADKSGFDSCSVPALLNFTNKLWHSAIEPCEAARFSAYISPDFQLYPCSFEKDEHFGVSLENTPIEEAWNSSQFFEFRRRFFERCDTCREYDLCLGGCPIIPHITICEKRWKDEG
ncbi:MAG: radical SAM protein [bacterium]|nr:radical SAM protein [bacterium]